MKTIPKVCPVCTNTFNASITELNRGNAKVCSRQCARYVARKSNTKLKISNVICAYCDKEFYISPSKFRNSKSGLYFCTRNHKDMAQRIESGFNEMWPSHYTDGKHVKYRKFALTHYGNVCQLCGYNKYSCVLQVHHIDHNRQNNKIENLLVCCPTCHMEQHIIDNKVRTKLLAQI